MLVGEVPAETMIGIAERTGLIGSLTVWMLNAVLRHAASMQRDGQGPRFAINLSTRTLTDVELPTVVDQAMKTWGVNPATITLEITESSMIADAERSMAMLTRLKAVGVALSIDDFGTGYSSLTYLKRYPLDELKIDRLFVAGLLTDRGDRQIVRSVINLAHNFDLRAVAEGVEDAAGLEELRRLGCDLAQGFVISAPLPEKAFRDWWAVNAGGA
jgi:EAL domain-containing protein (putative c-di-GMP-specific phosphodiesterase class I)